MNCNIVYTLYSKNSNMKKNHIIIILLMSFIIGYSCSDSDEDKDVVLVSALENLKAIPGEKQITLSWDNAEGFSLSHVEISCSVVTSDEKKTLKHEINGEKNSQVIIDVAGEKDVYKFELIPYGTGGEMFAPQEVKGKPYTNDVQIGMDVLLSGMKIESVMNGIKFSWNNPNNISCLIEVAYTDKGESKKISYDAKQTIPSVTIKMTNSSAFKISVVGIDEAEGIAASSVREEVLAPNKPYKLSKETWNIVDVSTQAAKEGNGSAACVIDETPLTRWQATTKGGNDWVIIDMGAPVVVDRFALARSFGNSDNSAWDVTFSAGNESNPVEWEYEYSYNNSMDGIFKVEFDRVKDGDQMYPVPEPITARYFKYRTDRMHGGFATHYGEISVYGYYVE